MPNRYESRFCWLLSVTVLTLVVGGCPQFWGFWQQQSQGDAELIPFSSENDLLSYFRQQATERYRFREGGRGDWFGFFPWSGLPMMTGASEASPDQAGTVGLEDSDSFTTTNIQEVGVDESDVIKSDGTYFYIAKGRSLRIVRATPEDQMAEVGQLEVETAIDSMYLFGSKLILLGLAHEYESRDGAEIMVWPPYYPGTSLTVYEVDISDPTSPAVSKQLDLDGSLVSSRLTNERVIIVLTIVPDLPDDPTPVSIGLVTLEQVMPKVRTAAGEQDMVPWQDWLYPTSPDGYFMTAVITLDANDIESILASVAVLANAGTIYASTEALYITDAEYDPSDNYREKTAIHKLAFDENGVARYVASGSVPGRLLNQFSLGEHEGYLRAATHVDNPGLFLGDVIGIAVAPGGGPTAQPIVPPSQDYNAVFVLNETGEKLEITGGVENIAPGETLHSARFLGDHGFLVTFRKIDPLFVLDLSDPANPEVVGELKVPGFSDYLHPLDDTHLIGVGKYTLPTDEGFDWFQGVQVSLFDVSDWSNPTAVQQITLGGRGSESEIDRTHKGFTFLPEANLLAIPMTLTTESEIPWDYGDPIFGGVVAFRVDKDTGFTELGRLEDVSWRNGDYYYGYYDGWRRAAFIGNVLYAITPDGVRAAPVSDLSATSEITLPE